MKITLLMVVAAVIFFFGFFQLKKLVRANKPGVHFTEQERRHIEPDQEHEPYNSLPPTSGPHYAAVADWGVYDEPVTDEMLVHNLEHGGVLLLHNDLEPETVKKMKDLFERLEKINGRVLMAPYPGLKDAKIALTAWGWLDKLSTYDENRIQKFFRAHVDNGPEKVPLGRHNN